VPAVRGFYALQLPRGAVWSTLLIAVLGVAARSGFWFLSRHHGRGPAEVARE
jgi:hypothetical protein